MRWGLPAGAGGALRAEAQGVASAVTPAGRCAHAPGEINGAVRLSTGEIVLQFGWEGPARPSSMWVRLDDGSLRRIEAVLLGGRSGAWTYRARLVPRRPVFAYQLEARFGSGDEGDGGIPLFCGPMGQGVGSPARAGAWRLDRDEIPLFATPQWVRGAVAYQIFPDRFFNGDPSNDPEGVARWGDVPTFSTFFGGDLPGIRRRLGYLQHLGVDVLYLTPIVEAPSNHRYDASDYLKVDPALGGAGEFRRLADEAHRRGMRIILDAVFNHTGDTFWAFQDVVRRGPQSPYFGWYFIYQWPIRREPPSYACWWNLPHLPKLNTSNPEVREHLFRVTRYWMELGADGWRLDVPNELEPGFWPAWRRLVKSIDPEAYIVGEIWHEASTYLRGDQFDGVMNYPLRDALLDFFVRRTARASDVEERLLDLVRRYPEPAAFSLMNLLGSHDTERVMTVARDAREIVAAMMLFVMAYPGLPTIYYGDEVGMAGGKDPDCRRTFPWDEAAQDTALWRWVRRLARLRRLPALAFGELSAVAVPGNEDVLAFGRVGPGAGQAAVCVTSRAGTPQEVTLELPAPLGTRSRAWVDALTGCRVAGGRRMTVAMPARGARLLVPEGCARSVARVLWPRPDEICPEVD